MTKGSIPTNEPTCNSQDSKNQNMLLYQDTQLFIELLQLSYQYHQEQQTLSEETWMAFLQEFMTWIETTSQSYSPMTINDRIHSVEFHRYMHESLWKEVPTLDYFFNATTYLVQYGVESFRVQNYPAAYETFLNQLEALFDSDAMINAGKQRTVYLLLEQLRQKPL